MASGILIPSALLLFTAFTLHICVYAKTSDRPVPKVGDSCDVNEDCGPGKCCVRLDPNNGTVCQNLSSAGAHCSKTQLEEHKHTTTPPLPSCRSDEESQKTKQNHTHPYDKHCPCKQPLTCTITSPRALADSATEDSVQIGACENKTLQS
uniref:Putative secreted protein n=1 Tax=Amblyomma americanum TaxID=6943 RepID=A0A0C9R5G7_AMBAM